MSLIVKWEKVPSVTTGGKPFFYFGYSPHKQRIWIMWDRVKLAWFIYGECLKGNTVILGNQEGYNTPEKAMSYLENT
jgi:hypothetical protein